MSTTLHQLERRERRGKWFVAIAILVSISVLTASWVGLFAFMAATSAHSTIVAMEENVIPDVDGDLLNFPDLSRVSTMYASNGTLLAELHDGRVSEPVRFEEVPDVMVFAVLGAEDSDFFEHSGVDWRAIASAFIDNLSSESQRGGSTITQQVVKKTFVGDEISYERKIREAVTAIELERRYSKEQILEFYLNSVYFGSSAYGVVAAAREFFDKELEELTVAEAATLAVLPRNPTIYSPRTNPESTLTRRNDVITEMWDSGFITTEQRDQAIAENMSISAPKTFVSPADHVVAEVKERMLNDPEFAFLGTTKDERKKAIFGCPADAVDCDGGGGLKIQLTIDLDLQNAANDILHKWLPTPEDPEVKAPTGAIATVDSSTGAILVLASGLSFEDEQFNLASQGKRNPGSSFKPFTLVTALEQGISLNSFWDSSSPRDFECPYTCSARGNVWRVSNAGGGGSGLMRLFDATYNSVNVVYAGVALAVGPENIVETAQRMGIESDLPAVPSITLGTGEVSPLEMASAYTNFSTNGLHADSYLVESITTATGEIIYQHQINRVQVVDAAVIAAARQPLEIVPVSGTAPRANIGRPQGGKTGTHQNYTEAWFVGFVPQAATAVWVGYPDEQLPLTGVTINGTNYARVFGGSVPAPIWKEFMQIYLADLPVAEFPADPEGITAYLRTPSSEVPSVVGLSEAEAVIVIRDAHLNPTITEVPSQEPLGTVIAQNPAAGATLSEGSSVNLSVSVGGQPIPLFEGLTESQFQDALATWQTQNEMTLIVDYQTVETGDPKKVGILIRQRPAPGTILGDGDNLIVIFAVKKGNSDN